MSSANPFFRSIAGAAPTVPSSWTMFTVSSESSYSSTSHWPAFLPSSTESEPRKVTYMDGSESTARSVSTTGMPAAFASLRTASQPVTTTGENAMTSTFCLMKERIAAIWFSCFCCASANLRSMPAAAASSLIDLVFAVRQPLSAPTWENPRVILSDPEPEPESEPESPQAARDARASAAPAAAARILRFIGGSPSRGWGAVLALTSRGGRREVEGGGSGADDGGGTAGAFRRQEEGTASGRTGVSPDGDGEPGGGAGRVVVVGDAGAVRQAVRGGRGVGGRVAGDGSARAAAGPERPLPRGRGGLAALPAHRGSPPG